MDRKKIKEVLELWGVVIAIVGMVGFSGWMVHEGVIKPSEERRVPEWWA